MSLAPSPRGSSGSGQRRGGTVAHYKKSSSGQQGARVPDCGTAPRRANSAPVPLLRDAAESAGVLYLRCGWHNCGARPCSTKYPGAAVRPARPPDPGAGAGLARCIQDYKFDNSNNGRFMNDSGQHRCARLKLVPPRLDAAADAPTPPDWPAFRKGYPGYSDVRGAGPFISGCLHAFAARRAAAEAQGAEGEASGKASGKAVGQAVGKASRAPRSPN